MSVTFLLPAATALLALIFCLALLDQWRERRHAFQLVWAAGMLFFALAAASEAAAALGGWNELLYKTWYLTGAVYTAGWLGLGTAFLLGRTRFGYAFAVCLFLAGLFTLLTWQKFPDVYGAAGQGPAVLYFLAAGVLAVSVAVETYFQDEKWPRLAAVAVIGASALGLVLTLTATIPAPGYALDPTTHLPTGDLFPPSLRLLTPFMNVTGAFALILGAIFSVYVFMPKKRVLAYSLDPEQPFDQFLFNLLISPVAILVNFVASIPGALRAFSAGRINSRVPATVLIAIGAFIPSMGDTLDRFGDTAWFDLFKFLGVVFLFLGFLVSVEVFQEVRIPFTHVVLRGGRREPHSLP
ncbi:MAG: hypothetical protein ACHQZR_07415 [Candidatus Limnocylindrales bacterium]